MCELGICLHTFLFDTTASEQAFHSKIASSKWAENENELPANAQMKPIKWVAILFIQNDGLITIEHFAHETWRKETN